MAFSPSRFAGQSKTTTTMKQTATTTTGAPTLLTASERRRVRWRKDRLPAHFATTLNYDWETSKKILNCVRMSDLHAWRKAFPAIEVYMNFLKFNSFVDGNWLSLPCRTDWEQFTVINMRLHTQEHVMQLRSLLLGLRAETLILSNIDVRVPMRDFRDAVALVEHVNLRIEFIIFCDDALLEFDEFVTQMLGIPGGKNAANDMAVGNRMKPTSVDVFKIRFIITCSAITRCLSALKHVALRQRNEVWVLRENNSDIELSNILLLTNTLIQKLRVGVEPSDVHKVITHTMASTANFDSTVATIFNFFHNSLAFPYVTSDSDSTCVTATFVCDNRSFVYAFVKIYVRQPAFFQSMAN